MSDRAMRIESIALVHIETAPGRFPNLGPLQLIRCTSLA